ncbi:MAG TPA: ATP-binding protein [Candidatus Solibacter sp.]|nr:ATP-binding protein [Candidatus Solibacter sp.]
MTAAAVQPFRDSVEHILAEMKRLDLLLRRAVVIARQSRSADPPDEFPGLVISEGNIDRMVGTVDFLGDVWKMDDSVAKSAGAIDQELSGRQEEIRGRMEASAQAGKKLALPHLATCCGLSPAEVDILLIALAPELDPRYETLYAYLQNDVTRKNACMNLTLDLICRGEEEKIKARQLFSPDAPLLHFHLIELHEESYDRHPTELRRFLRMDETVTRFLLERQPRQSPSARLIVAEKTISDVETSSASQHELQNLAAALDQNGTELAIVQLWGGDEAPLKEAAEAIAHSLGKDMLCAELSGLEADPVKLRTLTRDAALWDNLLVIERGQLKSQETERSKSNQAEEMLLKGIVEGNQPVVFLSPDEQFVTPAGATHLWRIHVQPPDYETRREEWQAALPNVPDMDADRLADLFSFGKKRIQQSAELAMALARLRDPANPQLMMTDVLAAVRDLNSPNIQRFAVPIEPSYEWKDLVLPAEQMKQLHGLAARVKFRSVVHNQWDFGRKMSRGRGLAAIFSGPPGTGKTCTAEVLARELSLRLFQIDLAAVVSKYIGETEQHLSMIFREAELSQSLLFFDEADALFGKRVEVNDARDHYANMQTNYLLQRIEQYQGLVILATNFLENIDEAFLRRLHCMVRFPFPDERAREQIWKLQFPEKAPRADNIDFAFLAGRFNLAGANIRNVVLEAAFLAAQEKGDKRVISMDHIIEALHNEYHNKLGKLIMKTDLGPYSRAAAKEAS